MFAPKGAAAERFDSRVGMVASVLGAERLGYDITAVPPGRSAFPMHCHRVNEEMFFILEGTGELRLGEDVQPIRKGDIIACPPGGPETAHRIKNTGSTDLEYLAISTKVFPEICEYPDSGKFGLYAELPGADGKPESFRFVGRREQALDYWDGE